jgi:hypothetical protein
VRPDPKLSFTGLKQLDRIAIRIFYLNLLATGPRFHLIAEADSSVLEISDVRG